VTTVEDRDDHADEPVPAAADVAVNTDPRGKPWEDASWTWTILTSDFLLSGVAVIAGLAIVAPIATNKANQIGAYWTNVVAFSSFPLCIVAGMAIAGTYRSNLRSPNQSTFSMLKDFLFGVSFGAIVSLAVSNLLHRLFGTHRSSSVVVIAVAMLCFVLITFGRMMLRHRALTRRPVRVLLVDSGLRKDRISTHIAIQHGFQLVGWVLPTGPAPDEAVGVLDDLERLVQELQIDRVIIGSTGLIGAETAGIYRSVLPFAKVSLVPRGFELVSWRSRLTDLSGLPLLEVAPPLMTRWDRSVKRLTDIIGAVLAIAVTLPFWIILAIIIKVTSEGPVFFRQPRIGRGGREFSIIKFRTMTTVEEDGNDLADLTAMAEGSSELPLHVSRGKANLANRPTRVGAVLRKYGVDEIPQFLNVLRGDMSIVGPRPFVPSESDALEGWSARRFEVRPGITGLWQVSGRNELSAEDLRQLDYLYVVSWSFVWDLRIMAETPTVMVKGLGSY
jgi:exopolysaccharide biosynthesis polyprenyl glycosylphosphotransferase